jgi:catechol 2,3-dioxygenase
LEINVQRTIHPESHIREVTLKVSNLEQTLDFYTRIVGLKLLSQNHQSAIVGAGVSPIFYLNEIPGLPRPPVNAPGLYHSAILFPDRRSLAVKIAQLSLQGYSLGQADHLVSEAFYFSDPEGNGLELYRDRPKEEWNWPGGKVEMATNPIDFQSFIKEIRDQDPSELSPEAPSTTRLGHIHLRVTDLDASEKFYCNLLGFELTARVPGAIFVSAGGYHHHIGMNIWQSRGGRKPLEPHSGLREFTIALPDERELEYMAIRIEEAGLPLERHIQAIVVHDPAQNRIRLAY